MGSSDGNYGNLELLGYTFKRVESGLDEDQVTSLIKKLIYERDTLAKRQEHLSSLSRLFEKTIADADDLAAKIKREAEEQAQAESKAIIARTEEQGRQIIEEKKTEALAIAQKEAEAVKASAQKQSEALLEKVERIESQLRDKERQFYVDMLAQLKSLRQQVASFETQFEQELSELPQQNEPSRMAAENNVPTDTSTMRTEVTQIDKDTAEHEEWTELEILPPRGKNEIEMIQTFLDNQPQVKTTELMTLVDKTIIKVSLSEPVNILEALLDLPQVKDAEEIVEDGHSKIRITLFLKSSIDIAKDTLDKGVNRIISRKARV
jgi:cell division septum initiation protein DivIVA